MTLVIAVPCAIGLLALARPVTMLLFPQWDTLDIASILLAELSITVIFYSVGTIMNAILQSIGRMASPRAGSLRSTDPSPPVRLQ